MRDYARDGRPESRLDRAKAALRRLVADLPCGSRVALGLFTERRPFLLFEPIETCGDFAPLDGALASLDWRMAWEGDSRVAAGSTGRSTWRPGSERRRVITDGQESPPLPGGEPPPFEGKPGAVRGLIVGAGDTPSRRFPRYDDRGREKGFYGEADVPQENRFGPPPADAETREGYNPRNAPFGSAAAQGNEHLSSVREPYLRRLAAATGLAYAHLDGPGDLEGPVRAAATPRALRGSLDPRPFLGALVLALVLGTLGAGQTAVLRRRLPFCPPRRTFDGPVAASRPSRPVPGPPRRYGPGARPDAPEGRPDGDDQGVAGRRVEGRRRFRRDRLLAPGRGQGRGDRRQRRGRRAQGDAQIRWDAGRGARRVEGAGADYSYRMSDPDLTALPVSSYSATLTVTPDGDGSKVEWMGRFYGATRATSRRTTLATKPAARR